MQRPLVLVRDLMTSPVLTIRRTEDVGRAAALMHESDVRHLAVVDAKGRVTGIISNRDVLRAPTAEAKAVKISEIMTEDVLTVGPETPAREATALMLDRKIGALPVVDDSGHAVGIISETDFLRVAHVYLGGDRLSTDDD